MVQVFRRVVRRCTNHVELPRHPVRRARPRDAEIDEDRLAVGSDKHVLALQVTVEELPLVHVMNGAADLLEHLADPQQRGRARSAPCIDPFTLDELHHEERVARLEFRPPVDGVDGDDVRVAEGLERRHLAVGSVLESFPLLRGERAEPFARELECVMLPVTLDLVERSETAGANPPNDGVDADLGAGLEVVRIDVRGHGTP